MVKNDSHNQILTCLIGDPVEHSVSDVMFQYFANIVGLSNYKHVKLHVKRKNVQSLKNAINGLVSLSFRGANVTLPYKQEVIQYLDFIDKSAQQVGAVNTITIKDGKLRGYNTDMYGAVKSIETKLRKIRKSDNILVLGAGGAARAVIGSLPKVSKISVLSIFSNKEAMKKFQHDFLKIGIQLNTDSINDQKLVDAVKDADFIINTTPVGMYPKVDGSVLKKKHFDILKRDVVFSNKYFFDAVFNPFETEFLKLAKKYGSKTCPGIYMMINQGMKAFNLWTGKIIPSNKVESIKKLLQSELNNKYGK